MNIWIATTGNSDVQLITDDNWSNLYKEEKLNNKDFEPTSLDVDNYEDIYTAPARVLGIVYGNEFENYWEDLVFPLFDDFSKKLKDEPKLMPDKIILQVWFGVSFRCICLLRWFLFLTERSLCS